jgi:hypothetical protein
MFETRCKQGKLIISDRSIQVVDLFNRPLTSIMRQAVTGVVLRSGAFSDTVIIHTTGTPIRVDTVKKSKAREIVRMFS